MPGVIPSAEARERLPQLIVALVADPAISYEIGRHRRREAVLMSAARYDAMLERDAAVRDIAWAAFAAERVESAQGQPVTWGQATAASRQQP